MKTNGSMLTLSWLAAPWILVIVVAATVVAPKKAAETTFFRRGGGIDVSSHSKRNRSYEFHLSRKKNLFIPLTSSSPLARPPSPPEHQPTPQPHPPPPRPKDVASADDMAEKPVLKMGVVFPRQIFQQRRYQSVIGKSLSSVAREEDSPMDRVGKAYEFRWERASFRLFDEVDSVNFGDLKISPPPYDITSLLCDLMRNGSAAIIYFSNTEKFGQSTAATQYFMKMASFLGIPIIAWNADNIGLEKESSTAFHRPDEWSGHLQLAPSLHHQVSALLSILARYKWKHFGVLTSEIAGHDDFVQAIRDKIVHEPYRHFVLQNVFLTSESSGWNLSALASSEVRIVLLYCTQAEATSIMASAEDLGLTSTHFMWLVTQSVIGNPNDRMSSRKTLPVGMIGVHFDVRLEKVLPDFVLTAVKVFFEGAASLVGSNSKHHALDHRHTCQDTNDQHKWTEGFEFLQHMKNVSTRQKKGVRPLFTPDGSVSEAQLTILNLKPSSAWNGRQWEEVGTWNSWSGLDIKDIVWPGESHVPPEGVPEKFHMKMTYLEEPPFIMVSEPDPVSSKCSINRGVPCESEKNKTVKCCAGLCIDLLRKFVDEMGFSYELLQVGDAKWGTLEDGHWNGLMGELVEKRTDMVLSPLKLNAQRQQAADFTIPFLETGIAIAVAKRTGIISPTAFLEPFDFASWMLVALVSIQASALAIFFFEWVSPSGYDMKMKQSNNDYNFSLFRTYWLVWAILFQASVKVDCPRGFTARFMSFIWALFAVVFLALYTANLAAFMIPREKYYDFSGIEDSRISNPLSQKPGLRFATVPYSYSQMTLAQYHGDVFNYMKQFSVYNTTAKTIKALKEGSIDALIYDGTVLNYLASQDEDCRLLQVGAWSAMTGYSLAFPKNSKYKDMFDKQLMEMRENGELERLSRFWMNGICKPNEQEKRASEPLSISQFLSAFLLLGIGTAAALLLLCVEHVYIHYIQKHVDKSERTACLSLISTSVGYHREAHRPQSQSLQPQAVTAAAGCGGEACWQRLRSLKEDLLLAQTQIFLLEKQLKKERDREMCNKIEGRRTSP